MIQISILLSLCFSSYISIGMESSHDLLSDDDSNTVAAEEGDECVEASANLGNYGEDQETQQGEAQQQAPDRMTNPPFKVPGPPSFSQRVPTEELRRLCIETPHTRMFAVVEGPNPSFPTRHGSWKGHDGQR